ncbi:hypothetical protein [uncultured Azohydromonas sp.]|jgi:hypothetical protein|uniref:hypothetical protein n=1 Tax=uncultured Azohydromonas sp. TaxID=487342 RepID=UPI002634D17E|nr:hypothetical protein [uncultured Azohydromonas sp.]
MAHLHTSPCGVFAAGARGSASRGGRSGVVAFQGAQFVLGASYVPDFRPGLGGDVISLRRLYAELAPAGCDGRHPFIDRCRLARDGLRVVQVGAGVLGGNSWLRLRQSGADLMVEADTGAKPNGAVYRPVLVLRGVRLAQIVPQNFDPPLRLGGTLVRAERAAHRVRAQTHLPRREERACAAAA